MLVKSITAKNTADLILQYKQFTENSDPLTTKNTMEQRNRQKDAMFGLMAQSMKEVGKTVWLMVGVG